MHGKVFTNICSKRHTSDIELQIVHTVWLKYLSWNINVKFTLTMFNSIYIICFKKLYVFWQLFTLFCKPLATHCVKYM